MHVRTTRLLCATAACVRVPDMTQTNASPKRVYIDFDDVLCETALGFTDIVRDAFGRDVAFGDIHSFDLLKAFDLTRDEYEHLMVLGHKDDFLGALVAIPGARDVLHAWREAGLHVSVVTGRPPECADISHAWLEQHDMPVHDIVFVDKYGRNDPGSASVTPAELAEMTFVLAVEDAPVMAEYLRDHTRIPLVLYDRPWNRNFSCEDGVPQAGRAVRGLNWGHIGSSWRTWLAL